MIDDIKKATIDRYVMKSEGHTNWILWSMLDEHEATHIQTCIKEDLPIACRIVDIPVGSTDTDCRWEMVKVVIYHKNTLTNNEREKLDEIQDKLTLKKHISNYSILKYGHDSWEYYDNLSPEIKLNPSRYGHLEDNILFFYEGRDWTELTDEHNVCPHCNSFLI